MHHRRPVLLAVAAVVAATAPATPVPAPPADPAEPTPTRTTTTTIPIVELDLPLDDPAATGPDGRFVIVDREPGQYLGHPTTVLLEDARTMLCVYPKGHGRGAIVLRRSEDGGRTWSDRLPVPGSWATSRETPTIHRVTDPATGGRRLLLFSGLHPIRLASSDDDGATWSELAPIGGDDPYGGIVAMASVAQASNGDVLAWFHDDGRFLRAGGRATGTFRLLQVRSSDGGRTWSAPRELQSSAEVHLCEPGLVRSPDGGTWALLLRENRRRANSHVMYSTDEGATWTDPVPLPAALTGDRHVATYAPDGRLFISFRDTSLPDAHGQASPTAGDWVGWIGTWEDLVERRPGAYRVRIKDNHVRGDCAYPGVEILPDGTIVTTTYGHWIPGEAPFILSARFTLAELDRLLAAGRTVPRSNG